MRADAKKTELPPQSINELLEKLDAPEITVDNSKRTCRQATILAAENRLQMIRDNEI